MTVRLIIISLFLSPQILAQNMIDSLLRRNDLVLVSYSDISSYNISTIEWRELLSENERQKLYVHGDIIFSKLISYEFNKKHLLASKTIKYTGVDSIGNDHFKDNESSFMPYSFPIESTYKYDSYNRLIFIEQTGDIHHSGRQFIYDNRNRINRIQYFKNTESGNRDTLYRQDYYYYQEDSNFISSISTHDGNELLFEKKEYVYNENMVISGVRINGEDSLRLYNPVENKAKVSKNQLWINGLPIHEFVADIMNCKLKKRLLFQIEPSSYILITINEINQP